MKLNRIIISLIVAGSALTSMSQSRSIDKPMTQAVMKVYQQQLEEDPEDYDTYFRRANEYYRHSLYDKALSDINNALKYTPASDGDMRFQEYSLRANIYTMQGRLTEALSDLTEALKLDGTSYVTIYQKANVDFDLGNYDAAEAGYNKLLRMNNRSQEALFGLARVAVKENNIGMANEYIEQAVAMNPSNAEAYVRRASVYQMMGNTSAAVDDLILAISTDQHNNKALQELVRLSNTDYSTVISGLSNAIRQAPRVGMFYYLRATIAKSHHRYPSAINDYNKIIADRLYDYAGIYASRAECYLALGNLEEALHDIDYAIGSTINSRDFYLIKSNIKRAMKSAEGSLDAAESALAKDGEYRPSMVAKALALVDNERYQEAYDLLGEVIFTDSETPYNFIIRGWIGDKYLGVLDASSNYTRALNVEMDRDNVKSLRGFALLQLGRTAEARQWMETVLGKPDYDGTLNYYGACLYAQLGDTEAAFSCMRKALENGYANYYDWTLNNDADINVGQLRDDARFEALLKEYSRIFE